MAPKPVLFSSEKGTPDRKAGSQNYRSTGKVTCLPQDSGIAGGGMKIVRNCFQCLLFFAGLLVAGCSQAEAGFQPVHAPRWTCWYSSADLTVQCLLSQVPTENIEQRAADVARTSNPRLPGIVRQIWGSPQDFVGERISVPLNSIPFEMEFVAQLARSAMCGRRFDCSVMFDPNRDGKAAIRAAALEAGAVEADVMAEVLAQGLALPVADVPLPRGKRRKGGALFAASAPSEVAGHL